MRQVWFIESYIVLVIFFFNFYFIYSLGLRALLALQLPLSPLTSLGQRNCASWASQPQKSVTFLPCPGARATKSTRTCGGIGGGGEGIIFDIK